ncbi:MAG: MATE family efflux transporter [Bacteroidaceae bacterium]|nr:MATE family efflux transporter [Bacteroidaceae bacterium]
MKSLHKEVLRLAVPSILANITVPLVGMVDIAIAGHISDASAIGGIAIGAMLFDLLYWNFGFLRIGTGGMTAQAFGRRDFAGAVEILMQSLSIAVGATLLIWALQWVFLQVAMALIPCSPEVAVFARKYFFIRIWAAPATLSLMAFKGWFIGMQDTVSAMICDIVVNVVNMAASFALAVWTPLGAIGVAWGTLIGQYTGLLVAAILLFRRVNRSTDGAASGEWSLLQLSRVATEVERGSTSGQVNEQASHNLQSSILTFGRACSRSAESEPAPFCSRFIAAFNFQFLSSALRWQKIRRLFVLNGNLFIRALCFMVVYVGFTSLTSKYGDGPLAVGSIMMKLFMLFSYFIDGFAYAAEALTGRFIGARDACSLRGAMRILFFWTLVIGVAFTLLYALTGEGAVRLMTSDASVIADSHPFLPWLIAMPMVSCLAFLWDGIFVGATAARALRDSMIGAAVGFLLACIALQPLWGIQAIYVAYFVHLLVRVLWLTFAWPGTREKAFA